MCLISQASVACRRPVSDCKDRVTFGAVLVALAGAGETVGEAEPKSPKRLSADAASDIVPAGAEGALSSANRSCAETVRPVQPQHPNSPTAISNISGCALTATGSVGLAGFCWPSAPPNAAHELSLPAAGCVAAAPLPAPSKAFHASPDALAPASYMHHQLADVRPSYHVPELFLTNSVERL